MKFNNFYNLHIPKTGGTYFRKAIINPNRELFKNNGISVLEEGGGGVSENGSSSTVHWAWHEECVKEGSYVFVALRDPVERIVSHFAWQAVRSIDNNLSHYSYEDINIKNFYKWLEVYNKTYNNFQSKNLVYFDKTEKYSQSKLNGWQENGVPSVDHFMYTDSFINFKLNKKNVLDNVKRCNLVVRSSDMKNIYFQEKMVNKIFNEDLKISKNVVIDSNVYGHENEYSKKIYKSLSLKNKEELYLMSDIDTEIYFSDKLFFNGNSI